MAVDDLNVPLGRFGSGRKRRKVPALIPQAFAGLLACSAGAFAVAAMVLDDPLGGEQLGIVTADLRPDTASRKAADAEATNQPERPNRYDGPDAVAPAPSAPANGTTITIIDGSSGKRQDVVVPGRAASAVPAAASAATPPASGPADQRFTEVSRHGAIPRIASDGARPSDAFARKVKPLAGKPDAPRVALVVGGLGTGTANTADAIAKLPEGVTLAFLPYSNDLERMVARAREQHEVLLQVPMEPFDYPDNDPGPQTLLTSIDAGANLDRLHWLMSRFQGYVGLANYMGARFLASEQALAPVLKEAAKRGLIYVDDGSAPRSLAAQMAGANTMPFAKADLTLDTVPTAADIDRALGKLEATARQRGIAVGFATALPVSIDRIARWAKAAEARGILLVPISAVANKPKSS